MLTLESLSTSDQGWVLLWSHAEQAFSIRPLAAVLRENLQSYLRAESEGHDAIMLGLAEHEADLRALQARLEAAMDEPVPGGDPLARFSIGALRHQAKVKLTR